MMRCCEISVYQSRNSDWGGGREAGRKGCWQARKGNFAMIGGVCVWFLACGSTFVKEHKICNRLICNMTQYWNLHIWSPGKTSGGYAALRGLFCGFWAHGSYIFWRYINFEIDWYIISEDLENLIFHSMGSPQGLFWSKGLFLLILSIWILYLCEST